MIYACVLLLVVGYKREGRIHALQRSSSSHEEEGVSRITGHTISLRDLLVPCVRDLPVPRVRYCDSACLY